MSLSNCDVIKSSTVVQNVKENEGSMKQVDYGTKAGATEQLKTNQRTAKKRKLVNENCSEEELTASGVALVGSNILGDIVIDSMMSFNTQPSIFPKKKKGSKKTKELLRKAIQTRTVKLITDAVTSDKGEAIPDCHRKVVRKTQKSAKKYNVPFHNPNGFKFRTNFSSKRTKSNLKQFNQIKGKSVKDVGDFKEEIKKFLSLFEAQKEEFIQIKAKAAEEVKNLKEEIKRLQNLLESQKQEFIQMTEKSVEQVQDLKEEIKRLQTLSESRKEGNHSSTANTSTTNDQKLIKQESTVVQTIKKSPTKRNASKHNKKKFLAVEKNIKENKENSMQGKNDIKEEEQMETKQITAEKRKLEERENVIEEPSGSNPALIEISTLNNIPKETDNSTNSMKVSTRSAKSSKKRKVTLKTNSVSRKTAKTKAVTTCTDNLISDNGNLSSGSIKKVDVIESNKSEGLSDSYFYSPDDSRFHSGPENAACSAKTKSRSKLKNFNSVNIEQEKTNSSVPITNFETQFNDPDLDVGPVEQIKIPFKNKKYCCPYAMIHTFDERRDFILREQPKIILIKEMYPWLFSFEEIRKELDRLHYSKSSIFFLNVAKYSDQIIATSVHPFKEKVLEAIDAAETPKQRKHVLETGSLLLLPKALKEGYSFLKLNAKKKLETCKNKNTSMYPYIRAPSSCKKISDLLTHSGIYQVVVDDCVICKPHTLSEALLALMASIFIFNIEYDPDCYATFVLMETLFLEISVTLEIPKLTKKVVNMLKPATSASVGEP